MVKSNRSVEPPAFTPKQGQYLAYLERYTRQTGRPLSEAEIQACFGVSPPSLHQMILTLERKGWISRTPGQARSIRVLVPPDSLPAQEVTAASLARREPGRSARVPASQARDRELFLNGPLKILRGG